MEQPWPLAVGKRLRCVRQAMRFSLRQVEALTKAAGEFVSYGSISQIERAERQRPDPAMLEALAHVYGWPDFQAMMATDAIMAAGSPSPAAPRETPSFPVSPEASVTNALDGMPPGRRPMGETAEPNPAPIDEGALPRVPMVTYGWYVIGDPNAQDVTSRPNALPSVSVRRDVAMLAGARGYLVEVGDESLLAWWEIKRGDYCVVNPDLAPRVGHLAACRIRAASGGWRLVVRELVEREGGRRELVTTGPQHFVPIPASDAMLAGLVVRVQPADFSPVKREPSEVELAEYLEALRPPAPIVRRIG